jgi:prepilin-type N-terminal cleavage/methylation domain-containing protein
MSARGFTLIEAMVSMAVASFALAGSLALCSTGQKQASRQDKELSAFTIAQQKMEMLSSVPVKSPLLASTVTGDVNDASALTGVDGPPVAERSVDALGLPNAAGPYLVYWKIEPEGTSDLRRVKVYVRYPPVDVEANRVALETFR